jgi:hypothetical protein
VTHGCYQPDERTPEEGDRATSCSNRSSERRHAFRDGFELAHGLLVKQHRNAAAGRRAGGPPEIEQPNPRGSNPASEKPAAPQFDPRSYTPEQLDVIEAALRLSLNPPKRSLKSPRSPGPVRALDLGLQSADRLSERVLSGRQQLAGALDRPWDRFRRMDCRCRQRRFP